MSRVAALFDLFMAAAKDELREEVLPAVREELRREMLAEQERLGRRFLKAEGVMRKLNISKTGLDRLRTNEKKGFPKPHYPDSDPRWFCDEVEDWMDRNAGAY